MNPSPSANFCITRVMSTCSAGREWQRQVQCRFARKAPLAERCLHYIPYLGGHCDSLDAQREERS